MSWINLSALWKIWSSAWSPAPACRPSSPGACTRCRSGRTGPGQPRREPTATTPTCSSAAASLGMVIAAICFLIVLAAIGWGIYEIYQIGHPAPAKK